MDLGVPAHETFVHVLLHRSSHAALVYLLGFILDVEHAHGFVTEEASDGFQLLLVTIGAFPLIILRL